jgi:hypothetical protein
MSVDLRKLSDLIKENSILLEASKGHLDHPEDLVITQDIDGATDSLQKMINTVKNPTSITIKWDGYPALIFGHGTDNKFSIMDKNMFNKKDGTGRKIYSPLDFANYDKVRGVDRPDLHRVIANIWKGLEEASSGTKGYYWGDLLFGKKLTPHEGYYRFKANPHGITYTIDVESDLGKKLLNKLGGIGVHHYLDASAISTDDAISLNGTIGKLKDNTDVAIIPSAMPIVPKLDADHRLIRKIKTAISTYSKDVHKLFSSSPIARGSLNTLFTTFINNKIRSGNLHNMAPDFMTYVENKDMTASMKQKLAHHFNNNKQGIIGLFTIWLALYELKMNIVHQLMIASNEGPVKGYLNSGNPSQEGFVSQGLKFVDRLGFSRQNLLGNR